MIRNKSINAFALYFIVVGILFSLSEGVNTVKTLYYESKDYNHWGEYVNVEPNVVKDIAGEKVIQFTSTVKRKRVTDFEWVDLLYCDTNADGQLGYFSRQKTSKKHTEDTYTIGTSTLGWYYGGTDFVLPPVGTRCRGVHEITYYPHDLKGLKNNDRVQIFTGKIFTIE